MFEQITLIVAGLAGLGGVISILVNLLKMSGVVKPGTSDQWFAGINFAVFTGVAVVYILQYPVNWGQVDEWLRLLAGLLGLLVQMLGGRLTYEVLRGTPVIGYTFQSEDALGDELLLYREMADIIVRSIEQAPAFSSFNSAEKKQRAMMELSSWLDKQGVELEIAKIDMLIEAAVQEMNLKPEIYVGLAD